jgi:hypothetical protein
LTASAAATYARAVPLCRGDGDAIGARARLKQIAIVSVSSVSSVPSFSSSFSTCSCFGAINVWLCLLHLQVFLEKAVVLRIVELF